jgi:hypothetical protein
VSVELLDAPLVLPALGDVLLGDVLLGASAGVLLLGVGVVVLLPDVLDPLLGAG